MLRELARSYRAGLGDFLQPLTAMAGVVDVPARAGNRPAAIQRFETIHDSGKIFDHEFQMMDAQEVFGCITPVIARFMPWEPPSWSEYVTRCEKRVQASAPNKFSFVIRLHQQARRELLAESRKHSITAKLRQIPSLEPIRSALAVALG